MHPATANISSSLDQAWPSRSSPLPNLSLLTKTTLKSSAASCMSNVMKQKKYKIIRKKKTIINKNWNKHVAWLLAQIIHLRHTYHSFSCAAVNLVKQRIHIYLYLKVKKGKLFIVIYMNYWQSIRPRWVHFFLCACRLRSQYQACWPSKDLQDSQDIFFPCGIHSLGVRNCSPPSFHDPAWVANQSAG